ncbi:MAG: hypothetical protein D3904_02540 [Candidatus Electrothrix sp. EH2]|nr:hypothetical protein [Candidatus Electrothrix sp. EH2]
MFPASPEPNGSSENSMFHLVSINCRYSHSCLALFYVRNALERHLPEQHLLLSQFTINDPYYATLLRISG